MRQNCVMPILTQVWFRQHPAVAGLLVVPVTMAFGALAASEILSRHVRRRILGQAT